MTARVVYLRRPYTAPRQPDEPIAAERFDYLDNPAVQIGAIVTVWALGFFAYACVAYGVDAVIGGGRSRTSKISQHHHREG